MGQYFWHIHQGKKGEHNGPLTVQSKWCKFRYQIVSENWHYIYSASEFLIMVVSMQLALYIAKHSIIHFGTLSQP